MIRETGRIFATAKIAHLSDDKTVAKMGTRLWWYGWDVGHPPMMIDNNKLNSEYNKGLDAFRKSVFQALELHANARHAPLQGIAPSARLIFARICFLGVSISRLCPKIENEQDIWDFTSIGLLARSLFESIMFFNYFCEAGGPDELMAKMIIMSLHDRCERVRLFTALKKPEDVAEFTKEVESLRDLLRQNSFFGGLEVKRQKELLNGYSASILTLRQMGDKYSPDESTWTIYQFLSGYAHSFPLSFMRNNDSRRDGLQNDTDKMYIPGVLTWLASLLDSATKSYMGIPSGIMDE
jgi:hypothetical protein